MVWIRGKPIPNSLRKDSTGLEQNSIRNLVVGLGFGTDGRAELSARFSKQGNDLFLVVDGNGTGTINFKLRTDDNPNIKGNALTQLQNW